MNDKAKRVLDFIIAKEGGYVNHPNDPGGETKFGISKRSYPTLDIKNLTREQAAEIYKRDYFDKVKGDQLPFWLGLMVADFAVNAGVKTSVKLLQKTLVDSGCPLDTDGIFGNATLNAALAVHFSGKDKILRFIKNLSVSRYDYYFGLCQKKPELNVFLKGWLARTDACADAAKQNLD